VITGHAAVAGTSTSRRRSLAFMKLTRGPTQEIFA
jgi:hypothetical protein